MQFKDHNERCCEDLIFGAEIDPVVTGVAFNSFDPSDLLQDAAIFLNGFYRRMIRGRTSQENFANFLSFGSFEVE